MMFKTNTMLTPNNCVSSIHMPDGLMGLKDLQEFEIFYNDNQLPFMWLQSKSAEGYSFLVIDPKECIANYILEVSNADTAFLEIENIDDVLILNIVTIPENDKDALTVNLVAPILIHRKNGKARQVILENYTAYSTHHPMVSTPALAAIAR